MRRLVAALAFALVPAVVQAQQPEQVVTPTYTHEHACYQTVPCAPERACYQQVPCETPCPPPQTVTALPCTPAPVVAAPVIHYEMRSKALFWTGAIVAAGGGVLIVGSMTWARESEPTTLPTLPCGTDPYFAQRRGIAPCKVSTPLLAAGASLAGTGGLLMFVGSERVAVGADGRQITVRVKF